MAIIKYYGIFPLELPGELRIDGSQTVEQTMIPLIKACNMPDDFFWGNHLVLLNGVRPEMSDLMTDDDELQILSYHDGG